MSRYYNKDIKVLSIQAIFVTLCQLWKWFCILRKPWITIQKNLPKYQKFARKISLTEFRYSQTILLRFRVILFHSNLEKKVTSNEQKVTSNKTKVTSNERKVMSNEQKETSNEQKLTSNEQVVSSKEQIVTSNKQRAKSSASKKLFLSFVLIMQLFVTLCLWKALDLHVHILSSMEQREFKIRGQESWKLFRLLSFGSKRLISGKNSSRNKRLSKLLYFR